VLLLNEQHQKSVYISLLIQSGNIWIHPRTFISNAGLAFDFYFAELMRMNQYKDDYSRCNSSQNIYYTSKYHNDS